MTEVRGASREPWIWLDIENTPHVLFLEPFIRALGCQGWDVRVTVKPQSQAIEVARAKGIETTVVGRGDLAGLAHKVAGGFGRSVALIRWARAQPGVPCVQLQCSRTASLAARALGVPAIGMLDYEGAIHWPMAIGCRSIWFPDILREVRLPLFTRRVARFYPGLKENLYLDGARLDRDEARRAAGVQPGAFFVLSRPPAVSAHYASAESWRWWKTCLDRLLVRPATSVLVVPRDPAQAVAVHEAFGGSGASLRVASEVVDGPALALAADLVVGAGGTMNREAAVLGTPVWSTFAGPRPGVDIGLAREGRLTWVHGERELEEALASLGGRHAPRGPYPEGLRMILDDVRRFLPARPERASEAR